MPFIAWIIIILATFENVFPFLVGLWNSPKETVFLGTVHHAGDYFYYLSQFAQGTYRWVTTVDLYTTEPIGNTIVGWTNTLLGRLFSLFTISPIGAYQWSIVIFFVALFIAAYWLAREALENKWHATIALYIFALYHAFPITRDGAPSYGDYFNNFATPRVRFGAVPHQLMLATAAIVLCYLIIRWVTSHKNRSVKQGFFIIIASMVLASLQPVLWAQLLATISITAIIYILTQKDKRRILSIYSVPVIFALLSGIIPAFYLSSLFQTPPFTQLKLWEAAQHTQFTVSHFISATGPIFLVALLALPQFLSTKFYKNWLLSTFCIVSFALFLSPISVTLGVSHVRFMSTLVILCLSIIATAGIMHCSAMCSRLLQKKLLLPLTPSHITLIILAALSLYLLPNHLVSLKLASHFNPNNAYHYITRSDHDLLKNAAQSSTPNDTFLIIWPYNSIFPALSGRRSYNGHALLTINAEQKDKLAAQFFDNKMTDIEAQKFIKDNHISHVIAYSWTTLPQGLTIHIATQGSLSLYRVNPAYLKPYSK